MTNALRDLWLKTIKNVIPRSKIILKRWCDAITDKDITLNKDAESTTLIFRELSYIARVFRRSYILTSENWIDIYLTWIYLYKEYLWVNTCIRMQLELHFLIFCNVSRIPKYFLKKFTNVNNVNFKLCLGLKKFFPFNLTGSKDWLISVIKKQILD